LQKKQLKLLQYQQQLLRSSRIKTAVSARTGVRMNIRTKKHSLQLARLQLLLDRTLRTEEVGGECTTCANLLMQHYARNHINRATYSSISSVQTYSNFNATSVNNPAQPVDNMLNLITSDTYQLLLCNIFFLNKALSVTTLFKYLLTRIAEFNNFSSYSLHNPLAKLIIRNLELLYFGTRCRFIHVSNISPLPIFNITIRRRLLKYFVLRKFSAKISF